MSRRLIRSAGSPKRSVPELLFAEQVRTPRAHEQYPTVIKTLPEPLLDYRFHPTRRWKLDFAWPEAISPWTPHFIKGKFAVEIEGGTWIAGRHIRPAAFEADCEKYAEALIMGWRVLRVTTHMVEDGRAIDLLWRLFAA